jgi:hypothetical protein
VITTVWVSWVPGSVKAPLSVVVPFSLIGPVADAVTPDGATLLTRWLAEAEPVAVSSSVIVTEIE